MKILLDIRVTVFFQRAIQPSAVLSYWKLEQDKCVGNDYSLYIMSTVSNSVDSVKSVNSVNSYSAVLPPSPMVFFETVANNYSINLVDFTDSLRSGSK